jgi:cytochrome c553
MRAAALALGLLLAGQPATAQPSIEACAACHGASGRSEQPYVPSLAGQPADFIVIQMILFREGLRDVPVMNAAARGLADPQIEALAAHFAALPAGPSPDRRARDAALAEAGRAASQTMRCAVCHLPSYAGRNQVPRLTGQREDFLARTLAEYRDGRRVGADTTMNGAVQGASDATIAALAHYLAQLD